MKRNSPGLLIIITLLVMLMHLAGCGGASRSNRWSAQLSSGDSPVSVFEGGYGNDSEGTVIIVTDGNSLLIHGFSRSQMLYGSGDLTGEGTFEGILHSFNSRGTPQGNMKGIIGQDSIAGEMLFGDDRLEFHCAPPSADTKPRPAGAFEGKTEQGNIAIKLMSGADGTVVGFITDKSDGKTYWFYTGAEGDGSFSSSLRSHGSHGRISGIITSTGASGSFEVSPGEEI